MPTYQSVEISMKEVTLQPGETLLVTCAEATPIPPDPTPPPSPPPALEELDNFIALVRDYQPYAGSHPDQYYDSLLNAYQYQDVLTDLDVSLHARVVDSLDYRDRYILRGRPRPGAWNMHKTTFT